MKTICTLMLLLLVPLACRAGTIAETFDGIRIQGAAPDPLLTALIANNFSNTVSMLDSKGKKLTWVGLNYNGSGTCIVRLMSSTTKASFPAIPVAASTSFQRVVNRNSAYVNYSGCAGTTTTNAGTGNSVLELH